MVRRTKPDVKCKLLYITMVQFLSEKCVTVINTVLISRSEVLKVHTDLNTRYERARTIKSPKRTSQVCPNEHIDHVCPRTVYR